MSLSRNSTFFKEYAKSGYLHKMNPQFEGIAKKYYHEKHEHQKVHLMKKKLDQEVAYVERIQRKMNQHLLKKKQELKYAKEVNNRFHNDLQRREWLEEYKTQMVRNNKERANHVKAQSERKIKQAKMMISESKKSLADLNRNENKRIKELKTIKRAQQWDSSRSRVSQIYQFKKNVKENTNKFYKSKNDDSLSNYQKRIKSYKQFSQYDSLKLKELQNLKSKLQQNYSKNKQKVDQISEQIKKIQKQSKIQNGLIRSRLKSRSSSSFSNSAKKSNHDRQRSEPLLLRHS